MSESERLRKIHLLAAEVSDLYIHMAEAQSVDSVIDVGWLISPKLVQIAELAEGRENDTFSQIAQLADAGTKWVA
jgi:hypothetical protein